MTDLGKHPRRLIQIEAPSVTRHIARTLERYPDGGQILKELIQNADDAEATEVKFILDSRQYPTDHLIHDRLSVFQGPALYAWNNAVFKDQDWDYFGKMEDSSKEKDALKVGRFGVGFLSVFHITDLPLVISRDTAAILDPHKKYTGTDNRGWSSDVANFLCYSGHATSFGYLGSCSVLPGTTDYPATLFRFPLRLPSADSEISSNAYPVERVRTFLFQSFIKEAPLILLFLKHVEEISLYDGDNLLYKVSIHSSHKRTVRLERNALIQLGLSNPSFPSLRLYSMSVCVENFCDKPINDEYHWLLFNMIGSSFKTVQEFSQKLQILPWVGIAAPLPDTLNLSNIYLSNVDITQLSAVFNSIQCMIQKNMISLPWCDKVQGHTQGHVFCFLPLPSKTHLPINIHGYFSISDNRRSIEWPSFDNESDKAIWNRELVLRHIAPLYSVVIGCRSKLISYTNTPIPIYGGSKEMTDPYAAWPLCSEVRHKEIWSELVKPTVHGCMNSSVFWSAIGCWVSINQAIFLPKESNVPIPNKAIEILYRARVPIVNLPDKIWQTIIECNLFNHTIKVVTPFHVRCAIKQTKFRFKSYEELHPVLEYILSDIVDRNYTELEGLDLVPLATVNFQTQVFSSQLGIVYMLTKENIRLFSLLPGIEASFINLSILHSPLIEKKFNEIATSSKFQLRLITPRDVCSKLLPQSIKSWKQFRNNEFIKWQPNVGNQPSYQWIVSLWQWLCDNPSVLSDCIGLPILPQEIVNGEMTECILLPIPSGKNKYYISQVADEDDKIISLLNKLGGVTMKKNGFVFVHMLIQNFVQPASVPNLLQFLIDSGQATLMKLTDQRDKGSLRESIAQYYYGKAIPINLANLIRNLPIFEIGVGGTTVTLTSLELNKILPPLNMMFHPELHYPQMLCNTDGYVFNLLSRGLQCKVSSQDDVYLAILTHAINQCSSSSLWSNGDNLIIWTMTVCPKLSNQLINFLSNQRFIRTNSGLLKKPSELYNPYDEQFQRLFDDSVEQVFPHKSYVEFGVLNVLNILGLKSWTSLTNNSKSFTTFMVDRAKSVSTLSLNKAFERSYCILEFLGLYTKYSSELMEAIKSIKFLIVEEIPPNEFPCGLAWCGINYRNKLESPDKLCFCDINVMYLVGSILPILSTTYLRYLRIQLPSTVIQQFLLPTPDNVILQLSVLIELANKLPPTEIDKVCTAVHKIYEYLNRTQSIFKLPKKWIWFKKDGTYTFMPEEIFVLRSSFDFTPFIYSVYSANSELTQYGRLFKESGIRNSLSCEDLIGVLQSIKQFIETPLSGKFIKMSVVILDTLEREKHQSKGNVYLPTTDCTLCSAKECTYDDREWHKTSIGTVGHNLAFVHKSVTPIIAKYFGVEPLSQKIAPSIKLGFKYIQVGQKEDVTRRLNGIVNDYSGKNDVFKEVIQNADDARATEMKFVLDCRTHRSQSLFTSQMRYWQGPALIAYNNATFSDQDFDNVCELAGETKMSDPLKTGRFGVGFCACYSLTDVPSFLSRRFLTIFDPHTKYLGDRVSHREPGMRMDLIEVKGDLQVYQDQFAPYDGIFGCNIFDLNGDGYNGTIFRFPIRMKGNPQSKISKNFYDLRDVKFMLNHLEKEAEKLLLFLKNIKCFEVYVLDENAKSASEMKLFFRVEKKTKNLSSRVEMIRRFVENPTIPQDPICDNIIISVDKNQQRKEVHNYVLASALSYHGDKLKKGLLPLAELVVEVTEKCIPIPYKDGEGLLFCFLPLPLTSSLPFHINGYFDVGKDRRGLRDAQESNEHLWNKSLIQHSLPLAFECALENIARNFNPHKDDSKSKELSLTKYYSLWPGTYGQSNQITGNWLVEEFTNSVRMRLLRCNKSILWSEVNNGKWVSVFEAVLFKADEVSNEIETDALEILHKKSCSVIRCPKHVHRLLNSVIKHNNHLIDYRMFVKNILFPNLTNLPKPSTIKHLLFIIKKLYEEDRLSVKPFSWARDILNNSKCIPVKGSNSLSYPGKLIHSKCVHVAKLFKETDGRFVDDEFTEDYCTNVLISLGMVSDILPVTELADRARTICQLKRDEDFERTTNIFKYIIYIEASTDPTTRGSSSYKKRQEHVQALSNISFLKALPNSHSDFIPWCVPVKPLFCPSELFCPEYVNLVFNQRPVFWHHNLEDLSSEHTSRLPLYIGVNHQEPSVEIVLDNLCTLIEKLNHHPEQQLEERIHTFLDTAFQDMYKFLNERCETDIAKRMIHKKLANIPCIWQDRKLLLPSQVVCEWEYKEQYYPYMSSLSMSYKQFECFFVNVGVEKEPCKKFLIKVLAHLQRDYNDNSLSNEHLGLVIILSRKLAQHYDLSKDEGALLPDENRVLRPCNLLTCDHLNIHQSKWVSSAPAYAEFLQKGGHHIHLSISRDVAMQLGACTILDAILKDIEDHGFLDNTEFGQHENLVDRLNGILKKYPPDTSIFKEFIQNSDDAKASEIVFVLDHRINHPDARLLSEDPGWKKLQNVPALCIFNNKPFVEDDIIGICKLGIGGKGETSDTIGRFGIGFNVAYHLTDCPTFVSFDKNCLPTDICAFDPLKMYCAGGGHIRRPGRRWKSADGKLSQCPDQFSPFLLDLFGEFQKLVPSSFKNINEGFTMFRLPLIHCSHGNKVPNQPQNYLCESRIHNTAAIKQLLLKFKIFSRDILLFLSNIKRLSVFEVDNTGKCLHHFSVEASCLNTGKTTGSSLLVDRPVSTSNEIQIVTHEFRGKNPKMSKWIVNKQTGVTSSPDLKQLFVLAAKRGLEAVGGTATLIDYSISITGSLFCFLPVSISSCLPVHLNGYFLLDDSRNHLGRIIDLENWNYVLAERVLVPSYIDLILKARDYVDGSSESIKWFYRLFPDIESKDVSVASVLKINEMFYRKISEGNHSVLLDERGLSNGKLRWLQINKGNVGLFCDSYVKDRMMITTSPTVHKILVKLGMPITCAPHHVFNGLCKTSRNYLLSYVGLITPEKVTDHLKNIRLQKDTTRLILDNCIHILEFCLQDCSGGTIKSRLRQVPILKSKADTLVDTAMLYSSQFSQLLPKYSGQFIHSSLEDATMIRKKLTEGRVIVSVPLNFVSSNIDLPSVDKPVKLTDDQKQILVLLWQYFEAYNFDASNISQSFISKPIIPSTFDTFYPCKLQKCVYFMPTTKSTLTLPLQSNPLTLMSALNKLGYPNIKFSLISNAAVPSCLSQMISSCSLPNNIVLSLQLSPPLSGNLTNSEITEFFYILGHCTAIPTNVCVSLRRLPLFETFDGKYSSLEGISKFLIVPLGFPMDGLKTVLKQSTKCLFLKFPDDTRERVYSKVIPNHDYTSAKIPILRFYNEFVVPQFAFLTDRQMKVHLKMINSIVESPPTFSDKDRHNDEAKLMDLLKKTPLIVKDGVRCLVSDFYEPSKFHDCFNSDWLLPEEWTNDKAVSWLLLKRLGLRTSVSNESWLYYARRIANEGAKTSVPHENLIKRSNTLVQSFKEKLQKYILLSPNKVDEVFLHFLKAASKIKFIHQPSASRLEDLLNRIFSRQSRAVNRFVQLNGAVFNKSQNLVCYTSTILPKSFDFLLTSEHKIFLELLSITEPITLKMVIQNLIELLHIILSYNVKVCAPNKNRINNVLELKRIFEEYYKFLDRHFDKDQDCKQLINEQCFLLSQDNVSLLLVEPTQLVKMLPKSLSIEPFCYKIPSEFLRYPVLLNALGVKDELEAIDYLKILSTVKKEMKQTDIKVLNDDIHLYNVCTNVYKLLINALRNDPNYVIPKQQSITLPSIDFKLLDSTELYYNDIPWIAHNIKDEHRLKFLLPPPVDQRGQTIPPSCLKVKLLSELAVVELSSNILNPSNRCAKQELFESGRIPQNCSVINSLKETLESSEFIYGLERLYWHENQTHPKFNTQFCKRLKTFSELSTQQRIHCVNCIQTILKLGRKEIPGTEDASYFCYLKKTGETLALFVSHSSLTQVSVDQFLEQLASALKEQLGHDVKNELPIKAMLKCSPHDITFELDKLKISPFDSTVQISNKLLEVGAEISIDRNNFRKEDLLIFCNYYKGEKVLYHCLVDNRPVLKVGCIIECKINHIHLIDSIIRLHSDTENEKEVTVLVSPLQVYKELSGRDYALLLHRQEQSQYSIPLILITVPQNEQELYAWLLKVIKINSKNPYCLMTHLRQRLVAHMHYLFLFNLYRPSCFHFALTTIIDLMKYENNIPCGKEDATIFVCKKLEELSVGDSNTVTDDSDGPTLLDHLSKAESKTTAIPVPVPVPAPVKPLQYSSGIATMPRLNMVAVRNTHTIPIACNRFPQMKSRQPISRYIQGTTTTTKITKAPLPLPSTDPVKAKAWFLQAKVDYMSACDVFMNSVDNENRLINIEFTDEELMEIDDCFGSVVDGATLKSKDSTKESREKREGLGNEQPLSVQCKYPALVCFLCHDVVEKCIKGIMYVKCGLPDSLIDCRNLNKLCSHVVQSKTCSKSVEDVLQLSSACVIEHENSSRYPNYHYPTCAPFSRYIVAEAVETLKIVSRLMVKVNESDMCDLIGEINVLPEIQTTSTALTKCISENTDYPAFWTKHDGELKLALLDEDAQEYTVVSSHFLSTLSNMEILRIERIQNNILWRKYIDCAKRMSEKNNGKTSEMMLFHGTRTNKPEQIYKGDASFDMRFSNTGLWGRGNYFAVNSSYSHIYAHRCATGQHQMLVAYVLTGYASACKRDNTLTHPPVRRTASHEVDIRYDSVSGITQDSKIFITYNNDQAYPAYLITYAKH